MSEKSVLKCLAKDGLLIINSGIFISTKRKLAGIIKESAEEVDFLRKLVEVGL